MFLTARQVPGDEPDQPGAYSGTNVCATKETTNRHENWACKYYPSVPIHTPNTAVQRLAHAKDNMSHRNRQAGKAGTSTMRRIGQFGLQYAGDSRTQLDTVRVWPINIPAKDQTPWGDLARPSTRPSDVHTVNSWVNSESGHPAETQRISSCSGHDSSLLVYRRLLNDYT